jgi:MinD superfamily P-loop ATPase
MIVSVASGKGGTGKSTVALGLALSLPNVQLIDCDVEEPNANLFLKREMEKIEDVCVPVPVVDESLCTHCGKCAVLCRYNALAVLPDKVVVFSELCHGCGLCAIACPLRAIGEGGRHVGVIERSRTGFDFLQGVLDVGEAMATPLIKKLKAYANADKTVILDCPPGAACPTIAAVSGSDYCVLVTEPTPFGLHDLKIAVGLCRKLSLRFGVVVNKDDRDYAGVDEFCRTEKIEVIMRIPYSRDIAVLYSEGVPFVEKMPEWKKKFRDAFESIGGRV